MSFPHNCRFYLPPSTNWKLGDFLVPSIKLIAEVQTALDALCDKKYLHKFQSMLNKNINYSTLIYINSILKGSSKDNTDKFIKSPSDICCFKYAPVVSCDVERVFSQYKTVLSRKTVLDRRTVLNRRTVLIQDCARG